MNLKMLQPPLYDGFNKKRIKMQATNQKQKLHFQDITSRVSKTQNKPATRREQF
jgi:hypothetical protein